MSYRQDYSQTKAWSIDRAIETLRKNEGPVSPEDVISVAEKYVAYCMPDFSELEAKVREEIANDMQEASGETH